MSAPSSGSGAEAKETYSVARSLVVLPYPMYDTVNILRVFLASPGDLVNERKLAKDIADQCNAIASSSGIGWRLELMGWEDALPGANRPQDVINRDVDRCQLFVGLLWKRWGSPPGQASEYTSGFQEEFERALERREASSVPEMWVYFKSIPAELLADPGDQLKNVLIFRQRLEQEKRIFYQAFHSEEDWRELFRSHLLRHLLELEKNTAAQVPDQSSPMAAPADVPKGGISDQTLESLSQILSAVRKDAEVDRTGFARLALLYCTLSRGQFDERFIEIHEGNHLYKVRDNLDLGWKEIDAICRSGLHHYGNENFPVWWALHRFNDMKEYLSELVTVSITPSVSVSAFKILEENMWDISSQEIDRIAALKQILSEADQEVKVSAIRYIGATGSQSELDLLIRVITEDEPRTRPVAEQAVLNILRRTSPRDAFRLAVELNVELLPSEGDIFWDIGAVDSDLLRRALSAKSALVRERAATELRTRGQLNSESAKALHEDPAVGVRKVGLLASVDMNEKIKPDYVWQILRRDGGGDKGVGLAALLGGPDPEQVDDVIYYQFSRAPAEQVLRTRNLYLPYGHIAYRVHAEREFAREKDRVAEHVADNFARFKEESKAALDELLGTKGAAELMSNSVGLDDFRSQKFRSAALKVLLSRGDESLLPFLRKHVTDKDDDVFEEIIAYFQKYGTQDDARLLLKIAENSRGGLLIGSSNDTRIRAIKAALSRPGLDVRDLVSATSASELVLLIKNMSVEQFSRIPREMWTAWLLEDNSLLREAAIKKFSAEASKESLRAFLTSYLEKGTYYYNVAFWLDVFINGPSGKQGHAGVIRGR